MSVNGTSEFYQAIEYLGDADLEKKLELYAVEDTD